MAHIRASLTHEHVLSDAEAITRLARLFEVIRGMFPTYNLEHTWENQARTSATFRFTRPDKGHGTGRAALGPGKLDVEVDAQYKLPWLVPVVLAEKVVKDEFRKAVEKALQ
jgi:hypothetical protein